MPLPGRRYGGKKSSTQAGPSTQTQRRQTQGTQGTQRGRRAAPEEEEEEEEEDAEEEGGEGGEDDGGASDDLERRVALLVRLALSVEHTRGTMRRDQINKVVFPNGNTRSFNHVLTGANDNLRKVFGLEIVELMTRAERDKVGAADDDAEEEAGPGRKKSKGMSPLALIQSVH
ncbi:hypothetical protein BDV93DRAFT_565144 [Ceratobasidium sp. AG-I]|nr:hypothetical protein BDV93DRAFT_565144 [Ceratobasidium sp. AG-I]